MTTRQLFLSVSILFVSALTGHAQTKARFVKLYNYMPLFGNAEYLGIEESAEVRFISLSSLSIAFQREFEDDRYNEFEIGRFLFSEIDDGTSYQITESGSGRYEFGKILSRKSNNVKIRIGGSLRYYYGRRTISVIDDTYQQTHGLILSFTPHLDWHIYKRLYFDLAPTLQLLNGSMRFESTNRPVLVDEEATAVDFFFQSFRSMLRMGVSWRI